MSIEFELPDGPGDIKLTRDEIELVAANITTATISRKVSIDYGSFQVELGGDVPAGMPYEKYVKGLINSANWFCNGFLNQKKNGGHIGHALNRAKNE